MENATKALVIAGAILVTVLLISVGLIVFNNARDSVDNTNTTQYSIDQFNSKFTGYLGTSVKGTTVRTLLNTIRTSNATEEAHQVKVNGSETIPSDTSITSSKHYTVDAEYESGYIVNITYSANS